MKNPCLLDIFLIYVAGSVIPPPIIILFAEYKKTLDFPNNAIKKVVIAQNSVNPNIKTYGSSYASFTKLVSDRSVKK